MFFELPPRDRLTFLYTGQPICFKHWGLRRKGPSLSPQLTVSHEWSKLMVYFNTSTKQRCLQKHFFSHGTRNKYNAFVNACLNALSYKPGPGYMELPYMQRKQYENRSELKFQTSFCLYSDLTSHGITAHYITLHHIRSHFISIIIIVIEQLLKHDF